MYTHIIEREVPWLSLCVIYMFFPSLYTFSSGSRLKINLSENTPLDCLLVQRWGEQTFGRIPWNHFTAHIFAEVKRFSPNHSDPLSVWPELALSDTLFGFKFTMESWDNVFFKIQYKYQCTINLTSHWEYLASKNGLIMANRFVIWSYGHTNRKLLMALWRLSSHACSL